MDDAQFQGQWVTFQIERIDVGQKKLTEVAQDGADEGGLDNTEFALHEREDLHN